MSTEHNDADRDWIDGLETGCGCWLCLLKLAVAKIDPAGNVELEESYNVEQK